MLKSSTLHIPRAVVRETKFNADHGSARVSLTSFESEATQFRMKIRQYNAAFTLTSLDVELDDRHGLRPFQIHGEIYYQIGTPEPDPGQHPIYAQNYLYNGGEGTVHQFARNPDLD
jgi:hypothetical protein